MGTIKDLTEAEDIKKRWQEYTEELYKKHLHDSDNNHSPRARHPGMRSQVGITLNKASKVIEFQLSHFKF